MGKDRKPTMLDDLNVDADLLKPEELEEFFEAGPSIPVPVNTATNVSLPAHIKRSHKIEEDEWKFSILCSSSNRISLRVGTKEQAILKRNRLYNARTYLKYSEKNRLGLPVYEGPLDDWSLSLQELEDGWYIIAINLKLHEGWQED